MPEQTSTTRTDTGVWRAFALASIALSIVLGFGLGGGLFVHLAIDDEAGLAWIASAQSHGHVQLYGWAGLMVLGVAIHFIPRLAGARPVARSRATAVLLLMVGGILLRTFASIALASGGSQEEADALLWILLLAVLAECGGVILAVGALARTVGSAVNRNKSAFAAIVPLGLLASASLVVSLLIDVANVGSAIRSGDRILSADGVELAQFVAQYGFLLPIAVAMSARLFPLYVRTPPVTRRGLGLVAGFLAPGVIAGGAGVLLESRILDTIGRLAVAMGVGVSVWVLGLLKPRVARPRQTRHAATEPLQWFAGTAYFWLLVAMVASLMTVLAEWNVGETTLSPSIQRHAFGAGFVTVLIVGMGQVLLPGFAKTTLISHRLLWISLVLSNIAVTLRVLQTTSPISENVPESLGALAGAAGATALFGLAVNTRIIWTDKRRSAQRV